jgi:hypothetical protein
MSRVLLECESSCFRFPREACFAQVLGLCSILWQNNRLPQGQLDKLSKQASRGKAKASFRTPKMLPPFLRTKLF